MLHIIIQTFSFHHMIHMCRADSRFAPSQWGTALLCNAISHWLGANLESALHVSYVLHILEAGVMKDDTYFCWRWICIEDEITTWHIHHILMCLGNLSYIRLLTYAWTLYVLNSISIYIESSTFQIQHLYHMSLVWYRYVLNLISIHIESSTSQILHLYHMSLSLVWYRFEKIWAISKYQVSV